MHQSIPIITSDQLTVLSTYEPSVQLDQSYQSESDLEMSLIQTLQEQEYEYAPHIKNEAALITNLRQQLSALNNYSFSDSEWDRLWGQHLANPHETHQQKTEKLQTDGHIVDLTLDNGDTKNIKLLDKTNIHNNKLQVINQYVWETPDGLRGNRYDVTVLVNGFPMVHIELKRRGIMLQEAFRQINRYWHESFSAGSGLFEYVQMFVISNGTETKYYSNSTRQSHIQRAQSSKSSKNHMGSYAFTSHWTDGKNKKINDMHDFSKTFFSRHTLLSILTRYCIYDTNGQLKIMRPYQIYATEQILLRIATTLNSRPQDAGTKHAGGFIWHTTGSGKTMTSFKTATLATYFPQIKKVLFVVDRKDLDVQTVKEFNKFQKNSVTYNQTTSVLSKVLSSADQDEKIVVTTIQKLDHFLKKTPSHPLYGEHVVIIFDECHRSQFGSMHGRITKAFKKYQLFGFTGTPIFGRNALSKNIPHAQVLDQFDKPITHIPELNERTTEQLFGKRLHTYTITDAISDGNVLGFRVSTFKTIGKKEQIQEKKVLSIDTQTALMHEARLEMIGKYIIENFAIFTNRHAQILHSPTGFNAIFAVESIAMAQKYYFIFQKLLHALPQEKRLKIGIIYSYAPKSDEYLDGILGEEPVDTQGMNTMDANFLMEAIENYNQIFGCNFSIQTFENYYSDVQERIKNRQLDLVIVVNMLLTGFDAPTLNTLFVDKNLQYHGLIQAFSRTNRICEGEKEVGNIVCFRGNLIRATEEAIRMFGNKEAHGIIIAPRFEESYEEYTRDVQRLLQDFPIQLITEKPTQEITKDFINLFGKIIKRHHYLRGFVEFSENGKDIFPERQRQNYKGIYLGLAETYQAQKERLSGDREDIRDDVVFYLEPIKQIDINLDYILSMISNSDFSKNIEEILIEIDASPQLRSKKELIEEFITLLTENPPLREDVIEAWDTYSNDAYKKAVNTLVVEENLKEKETYFFLEKALKNKKFQEYGPHIRELMQKSDDIFAPEGSTQNINRIRDGLRKIYMLFESVLSRKE